MTSIEKSLSTDFSNGLNPSEFMKILNSNNQIDPECIHIFSKDNVVKLSFNNALSKAEQDIINIEISNYVPSSGGETVKDKQTIQTTNSTTYQIRDTLKTEYLIQQKYIINWHYSFTSSDGLPDIRIIIDDAVIIHHKTERVPVVSSTLKYEHGNFHIVELTEGVHTISLQFRASSEKQELTINTSCLVISKLI